MKKHGYIFILGSLFLSSCTRFLYRPEMVHDPMLTEKGAINFNAGIGLSPTDAVPSYNIGAGISPIEGLVFKGALRNRVSTATTTRDNNILISKEYFRGNTAEFGLGYYVPLNQNDFFTVYGNFARGKNNHYTRDEATQLMTDSLHSNFNVFSIQPAYTFQSRRVKAALGMRFSMYQYLNIYAVDPDIDPRMYTSKNNRWFPVWDPYFNFEVGGKMVRANIQAGLSVINQELALKNNINTSIWGGSSEFNPQTFFKIGAGIAINLNYLSKNP